jgi:hypothetical protein
MIGLRKSSAHPSDEALLLVVDREASLREAARVRDHVAACPACHDRMTSLEGTLTQFVALHEANVQSQPVPAGSRAHLKARLAESARARDEENSWSPAAGIRRQWASASIALLIIAASLWSMRDVTPRWLGSGPSEQFAAALPSRQLTPGATRSVRLDELCRNPETDTIPPLDAAMARQVFFEYGLPVSAQPHYELDYLITPELGGSTDIHNLWPEPYSSTSWNAHIKDQLEDHLHQMVCEGKLPLATAQADIATDWIAAYKFYFHTDQPLTSAASLEAAPGHGPGLRLRFAAAVIPQV